MHKLNLLPSLLAGILPLVAQTAAQAPAKQQPDQAVIRMANAIRKEIVTLPNYGVFDWVTFSINNYVVTLNGAASRPTLKDSAERVVKKVEGVEQVVNKMEVLPLSNMDDGVRARVYAAIYGNSVLRRYNPNRGTPMWVSPARIAGGITNDPPPGFHPIHIIVKNGNVILAGVVDNEGDKNIANIQANSVSGVFSVENNLMVASDSKPKKPKK